MLFRFELTKLDICIYLPQTPNDMNAAPCFQQMCCPVIYPCGRWWTVHQRRSLLRAGWSVFMMRTVWNRLSGVNKHFVLFYCWGMNCQKSHVALLKVPSPLDRWVTRPSNALYVCGVVAPSHFSPRSLHFCYSSLYPLGVCVWGAGRFVFIVIKPLTPIICSSIHPCACATAFW